MVLQVSRKQAICGLALAIVGSSAVKVRAADNEPTAKPDCFQSHEQGQVSRNGGHLRDARASFLQCSNDSCPALVRKDCLEWLEQVSAAQPSVIIAATDSQGRDTGDVRFFIDDVQVAERLTGASVVLDPGEHRFRFEMPGAQPVERTALLREGEKDRKVTVQFAMTPAAVRASPPSAPYAPSERRASVSPLSYALAGTSLAAFGVFSYFAIAGKSLERNRASSCSPRCAPDSISPIKRDYAIADVGLAVGVVTAGLAVWSILSHGNPSPPQSSHWLDVRAGNGGVGLVLGEEF
jgi:hypothetical protein